MKKLVFLLVVLAIGSPALAFHIGPAKPAAGHGEVNLSVGGFNYQAKFDEIVFEQTRAYAQLGFGIGEEKGSSLEIYLRGGAAVPGDEKDFQDNFDEENEPFAGAGIKGTFKEGKYFSWGMCLQGAYLGDSENAGMAIRDQWEVELGFPFQGQLGPIILYAGPVFYHAQFKTENAADDSPLREDRNIGGFGGVGLDLGPFRLEAEAQYRSDLSLGGFLSAHF